MAAWVSAYALSVTSMPLSKKKLISCFCVCFTILVLATYLRFFHLSLRPLHNDEGVNFHFIREIFQIGYYSYSHENYHGPLYFYVTAFFVWLLGESEWGLRFSSAFFGLLIVLFPFHLARPLSYRFALIASSLLAVSPSLVFYSRYAIHEMMFLFFQFWFALALYSWSRDKKTHWIFQGAVALACLFSLKETFMITTMSCVIGVFLSCEKTTILWKNIWKQRRSFFLSYLVFVVVLFFCFSAGFRWFPGILEMFRAFPQWLGRGTTSDVGHFKPVLYYVKDLILATEPFVLLTALLYCIESVIFTLFAPRTMAQDLETAWARFLCVWCLGNLVSYSIIPYKTPWLVINIVLPLVLFLSTRFSQTFQHQRKGVRLTGMALFLLCLCSSLRNTLLLNFDKFEVFGKTIMVPEGQPYGPQNPFSYVHTSKGMLDLVDDIKRYRQDNPHAKVLVAVTGYWPLPFYLKDYADDCAYLKTENLGAYRDGYSILIADHTLQWSDAEFQKKYYRLSDVQESFVYFRR